MTWHTTFKVNGILFGTVVDDGIDGNVIVMRREDIALPGFQEAFFSAFTIAAVLAEEHLISIYGIPCLDGNRSIGFYPALVEACRRIVGPHSEFTSERYYNIAKVLLENMERMELRHASGNKNTAKQQRRPRAGYVYVALKEDGCAKIGRSIDPVVRLSRLGQTMAIDVDVHALIYTSDYVTLELALHEKYAAKRVRGEWFALDEHDLAEPKAMHTGVIR